MGKLKMAKECPPEILKKFADHGFEADWVKGEYAIFIGNYPSGKATKAQAMERLKKAAAERFPNAIPENVAEALYPAFDPDNKGEVGFVAAAKGLAILFSARIEIRALFSSRWSMKTVQEKSTKMNLKNSWFSLMKLRD